ncbi:MAG TPA: hypothetical protein VMJ66_06095 [Geobacteraceae bacterium]|nr:hypothetical protein [Geobacteraceae bacterium]
MAKYIEKKEETDLAVYEPVNSEFREHAYMDWRVEGKGIKMYGLRWKYVLLDMNEEERRNG